VRSGRLLASDLDRTLVPNGAAEESPAARPLLAALVAELDLVLAYVTGRRLELVEDALRDYELPRPDFVLADVGSTLYERGASGWVASRPWSEYLAEDWQGRESGDLAPLLAADAELELQEPAAQRPHKLSFYAPLGADVDVLLARTRAALARAGAHCAVVYSVDEAAAVGLVDVLPARSTKLRALEFLMAARGLTRDATVFAGDSGNDLEVLVSGIPSVLVANADAGLRELALRRAAEAGHAGRLYAARGGLLGMNGNYGAGILEGWIHFHPEDRDRLEHLARRHAGGRA